MLQCVRSALALCLLVATLVLSAGGAGAAVRAEPPLRLATQIEDRAGVLDRGRVQPALDDLRASTGVQLFVVFVDSFDGVPNQDWADRTATASDLGSDDYLLAVAVQDRSYAYSVSAGAQISDDALDRVAGQDIEPRLAADDWTGAVIAAAEGYQAELSGAGSGGGDGTGGGDGATGGAGAGDGPGRAGGSGSGLPLLLIGGGAAAIGALAWSRRRGDGRGSRRPGQGGAAGAGGAGAEGAGATVSTEELSQRANRLLVETDDAVRASEQELGFAVAEFGETETAAFSTALAEARQALHRGFTVRQRLEDGDPETEDERRRLLGEVVDLCTRADEVLDREADRFDELRDVLRTAPQRLEQVLAQADEVERRLPPAESALARLRSTYGAAALARIERNPQEARDRLEFARRSAHQGQEALGSAEHRGGAATAVRAAEEALGQVGRLLDAVERAGQDLADAVSRLPAALADLRGDLDAARAEGVPAAATDAVAAVLAAAEQTAAADPLGALHRVVEADGALEQSRTGAREAVAARRAAERSLEQALIAARAEVDAVEDFVATRRGAVGSRARTRLAEAARYLERAEALRSADPVPALEAARTADRLAEEAGRQAQADVEEWYANQQGGYGSGYGQPGRGIDQSGLLAGILLGQVLGGGGRGGGFGGGGFGGFGGGGGGFGGGGFGGGGFGGGFGGSGRRGGGGGFGGGGGGGRRGGGGRF